METPSTLVLAAFPPSPTPLAEAASTLAPDPTTLTEAPLTLVLAAFPPNPTPLTEAASTVA
jgi:hypothetical protein